METDYSRAAFKWHTYPLFCILALILISVIIWITTSIPALSKVTDYIFLVYLLILRFLPAAFAFCAIPAFLFSFKALRNQEPNYKVPGNLMISCIYLSAGLYFTYRSF